MRAGEVEAAASGGCEGGHQHGRSSGLGGQRGARRPRARGEHGQGHHHADLPGAACRSAGPPEVGDGDAHAPRRWPARPPAAGARRRVRPERDHGRQMGAKQGTPSARRARAAMSHAAEAATALWRIAARRADGPRAGGRAGPAARPRPPPRAARCARRRRVRSAARRRGPGDAVGRGGAGARGADGPPGVTAGTSAATRSAAGRAPPAPRAASAPRAPTWPFRAIAKSLAEAVDAVGAHAERAARATKSGLTRSTPSCGSPRRSWSKRSIP